MKTLIVSATYNEVSILLTELSTKTKTNNLYISDNFNVLITGIGSAFTIYNLTEHLNNYNYKLIINVGIAGAFNKKITIGDIVSVKSDCFADIGIDDNGSFYTLEEAGLISDKLNIKFASDSITKELLQVKAITVNTTSGSINRINNLANKFNPDIETMEGASVAFVANNKSIPVLQLRAISNYVEPRNKSNWNIGLAIKNLNNFLIDFILKFYEQMPQ